MAKRSNDDPKPSQMLDDNDLAPETDELSFEEPGSEPRRVGDPAPRSQVEREQPPGVVREAGMTEGETPEEGPTADDMAPETVLHEDGARSPAEGGGDIPSDLDLSVVDQSDIGGGSGLDEAELGRKKPLDGKKWDGDPDEPYGAD